MKCPRCGRRMEAGWYCAHCGQALPEVNVADRAARGLGAAQVRGLAIVGALALAGALLAVRARPGVDRAVVVGPPTPSPEVVAGAPTIAPATEVPRAAASPRIVTATPPAGTQPAAGPSPSPGPTPTLAPGLPVWRVPFLTRQPRLDGVMDEWTNPPLDITAVVFGHNYWEDSRDLSAQAVAGYDRELLFLGVQVTDDAFSQPERGVHLYLGDSLELQVDADRAGDQAVATYNADDYQLGLSPGDFASQPPEAFGWRPAGWATASIALAARRLADGYVLEAAIPWRLFQVDPDRTPTLGIALNVSDNDLPEPAQLTMVSTTPNRSWADPRSFGTLVLEPPGLPPAPPMSPRGTPPALPTAQQGPPP